MLPEAFLLVVCGTPFATGQRIPLPRGNHLLGRAFRDQSGDCIRLDSPYVSRRHALITVGDGKSVIADLGSRHGTSVNGRIIVPGEGTVLGDGDLVDLAMGSARFRYCCDNGLDATMEYRPGQPDSPEGVLTVDADKRECRVEGNAVSLVGKEFDLILLLYESKGKVVPYETIKATVWPERVIDGVADVSNGEVNALAYRLRKKLGKGAEGFKAVPRAGYMVE